MSETIYKVGTHTRIRIGKELGNALFLTVPVALKVLLPSAMETRLMPGVLGVHVFLPNLLILLFFLKSEKNIEQSRLKLFFIAQTVLTLFGFVLNDYNDRFIILLSGSFYYIGVFLGLFCRINSRERDYVGILLSAIVLALDLEVLLCSTGILTMYNGNELTSQSAGAFLRVTTTAGGATGTACLIYGLTAISTLLIKNRRYRVFVFVCGVVATLLTVSRGGILAFSFYVLLWLFKMMKENKRRIFRYIFIIGLLLFLFYLLGFFDAIVERNDVLVNSKYGITSGRDEHIRKTLLDYKENGHLLFGVGISNVFPSIELRMAILEGVSLAHNNAPHNSYILMLVETGLVGLLFVVLFWTTVVIQNRRNWKVIIALLPILVVLFNTETVVAVDSEYVLILSILLMLVFDKDRMDHLYAL